MTTYLRVKNWGEFQHYKDRNPPWIKFHVALLDDYEFNRLSDVNKAHIVLIWLFASKRDGTIPMDPKFLQLKLGLNKKPDLDALLAAGFLLDDDSEVPAREKWASRHVSEELRELVLERAGRKCQACEATEALEIDHIVPVSQGGDGSESNLQALCRSCNRRKRTRSTGYAAAEQVATQASDESVAIARSREERRGEDIKQTDLNPLDPPASEGSAKGNGGHRARKKQDTRAPDSFEISEPMWAWAQGQGVAHERIEKETAKFLDHHKAKGSLFSDWPAAWRKWMRNVVDFAARPH